MSAEMSADASSANPLGDFLRDRRARLDAAAFGFSPVRRRTPGLRREEVAQRANISPTWYTWLEQGRGGAPSVEVLERIAQAMMLTELEREHLHLLAFGRPPEVRYQKKDGVTPRLQRVLDAFGPCPAIVRTATWDVVAWNRAATVLLADYAALPPDQRNILRFVFLDPRARSAQVDWAHTARIVVGSFRVDALRAGAGAEVQPLVDELCRCSPEFKALWHDHLLQGPYGDATKYMHHPVLGRVAFEYSAFAIDGRTDLSMVVYNPTSAEQLARIATLLEASR